MKNARRLVAVTTLLMLTLSGCGGDQKVGKDIDLNKIKGGKSGPRLGENSPSPSPLPSAAATGTKQSPTPPKVSPKPQEQAFEVTLTAESPYFTPGQVIQVPLGTLLRFTNKDEKNRQPYVDGFFDAPVMKPGDKFEYRADTKTGGQVQIHDRIATFKVGYLEVY